MKQLNWTDEIVTAMRVLGGAARYSDLYEFIERTTSRKLTPEWKASVRRTIEDHSSDSKNFRSDDLFEHVSHGHWKLRGVEIEESELQDRERLSPKEVLARVFVREHWRKFPSEGDDAAKPIAAWCDDTLVIVRLKDGREIGTPLKWYSELAYATHAVRNDICLTATGVLWLKLDLELGVKGMLEGWKPPTDANGM